jgi:hypothetical protein
MIISHKHKFIYIAPYKCASTTMRVILAPFADINSANFNNDADSFYHRQWHIKPRKLKDHFADKKWNWDEYFKFTFVRNPWARMVSSFNYQKKVVYEKEKYEIDHSSYEKYKKLTEHDDFSLWLRDREYASFLNFLSDDSGNLMMDFIGKVENLQHDFNIICDKIGIPKQKPPHKNKTKHKHYTEYYDEDTKQIVAEKYAKDIEYFGYKFGE